MELDGVTLHDSASDIHLIKAHKRSEFLCLKTYQLESELNVG